MSGPLDAITNGYGAVLSAGTFTHGHLGPEMLGALLSIARSGALFVVAINAVHFETRGFAALLDDLQTHGRIGPASLQRVRISARDDHVHAADEGLIVSWRKR